MLEYEVRLMNGLWRVTENVRGGVRDFLTTEDGDTNLISVILVLVIVMAIAVIFRQKIMQLVTDMWNQIDKDAKTATGT